MLASTELFIESVIDSLILSDKMGMIYKEIDSLHDIVNNLEVRLEHQEQNSRRTSLRFHNIDVPVDNRGHIIHPVNTDDIIVDIFLLASFLRFLLELYTFSRHLYDKNLTMT
jgi:hypothetical protein